MSFKNFSVQFAVAATVVAVSSIPNTSPKQGESQMRAAFTRPSLFGPEKSRARMPFLPGSRVRLNLPEPGKKKPGRK